ncbi:MAG TPA: CAP domain-containing protein [Anaerolineales bacterium]|nr:CAP domain-containing protein [Anaerolineales bacterium]
MTKKLSIITLLIMLTLSACSGRGTAPTATPAVTDTQPAAVIAVTTAAPTMTETSTAQPSGTPATATPTVGTVAPTNPANCTNSASFVADITVPDDTNVAGGSIFTKTWRIANNGTCVWGPDYKLTYYSEERMSAPESVPLGIAYPGQNLDISVNLTAPTSPGRHQANFVIKNAAGLIIKVGDDSRLWVVINVTVGGGAAPTTAATATATKGTTASGTLAAATLPAATVPAATVPVATTGGSNPGTASCLYAIDRTKLMEVISAVNAYRAEKSLPAYSVNPKLAQAAQKYAGDMACNHLSAHTGSDNSTPQSRVAATGYVAASVAENVYSSTPPFTGTGVVNFWITDTADANNNQNLLSTTFTEIGVGYASFGNSGYYVIVFAKP